jgi:hypothetical protein
MGASRPVGAKLADSETPLPLGVDLPECGEGHGGVCRQPAQGGEHGEPGRENGRSSHDATLPERLGRAQEGTDGGVPGSGPNVVAPPSGSLTRWR